MLVTANHGAGHPRGDRSTIRIDMNVAQVVATHAPYRGGIGTIAAEYTERLRRLGHDTHIFTPLYDAVRGDPLYVHRLAAPVRAGNAAFIPSLHAKLRSFDLVHLHHPFFGGSEVVLLRKAMHPRQGLVVTYHMDAVASGAKGVAFRIHERLVLPRLLGLADRILVSSRDYAEASALARVPGVLERVDVHPFGVDLERFHPGHEPTLKASLGIAGDELVLIFVGTLDEAHYFKGLPILFEALRDLKHTRWHLVVVGEGPLRQIFERSASRLGLRDRIHFTGGLASDALPAYYRLADVHVLPSTERSEAFGLVCLEAAASGIPSVASNLPGVRTVVRDGETGLLTAPGDPADLARAVAHLLGRSDLRIQMGRAARAHAERYFSWNHLMDRLENTYHEALRSASRA